MVRKEHFCTPRTSLGLGSYAVSASFKEFEAALQDEIDSGRIPPSSSLFMVFDDGLPLPFREELVAELSRIYRTTIIMDLPGGDQSKTIEVMQGLIQHAFEKGVTSSFHIAAAGGGAVLDVVSFFASVYLRGCTLLTFPTTLLAMTDAAIGGKNGINWGGVKNLVGTVYFPSLVYAALPPVTSQPLSISAMSEMWKHALITSYQAYEQFQRFFLQISSSQDQQLSIWGDEIFSNICQKMAIVIQSLSNPEARHLLNLGHTVAHALEYATHGMISHGAAVLYGVCAEAWLGYALGIVSPALFQEIQSFFCLFREKEADSSVYPFDRTLFRMALSKDKKNTSALPSIVLLRDFGQAYANSDNESLRKALTTSEVERLTEYVVSLFMEGKVSV